MRLMKELNKINELKNYYLIDQNYSLKDNHSSSNEIKICFSIKYSENIDI
jgi:hypothetical protein